MASLLGIGVSGLRAHQEALAVTGQNITNANTPGYSRQRVDITTQFGAGNAVRFDGAGARVASVERVTDQFAVRQVISDQSLFSQMDMLSEQMRQIETVFFGEFATIDQSIDDFFGAVHTANASPGSVADRQIVLNAAQALGDRFASVHARLVQQSTGVRSQIDASLARVNELASGIADLNVRIGDVNTANGRGAQNALLDQRDVLLQELAEYFSITTTEQEDGALNVFIGKGQPLVLGARAATLEQGVGGEVTLQTDVSTAKDQVTSALSGGEIGALLEFRDRVLTDVFNQVGSLLAGVVHSVNEVQQQGIDLQGDFGVSLFTDLNDPALTRSRVVADTSNQGSELVELDVFIDEPLNLSGSDYALEFSEAEQGAFVVRRLEDGAILTQGIVQGGSQQEISFDGVTLRVGNGEFHPGDRFIVSPVRDLPSLVRVEIQDSAKLALASPVRLSSTADNTGNAALEVTKVTDAEHPFFSADDALVPPLQIVFTSPTTYDILDASDPANPVQLDPPLRSLTYSPGAQNQLLPASGSSIISMVGTSVGALPGAPAVVAGFATVGNNYPPGSLTLSYLDPGTGAEIGQEVVGFNSGASAREIAELLNVQRGVTANAFTEAQISNVVNNGAGDPLQIAINGQVIDDVADVNELADAISANTTLAAQGIRARSDGETLTLTSLHGDDLSINFAGDPTDSIDVIGAQGQRLTLNGAGTGNSRAVSIGGVVGVQLAEDVRFSADAAGLFTSEPAHQAADFGFNLALEGIPDVGDRFDVTFNRDAISDNRNGLRLAELNSRELTGDPPATFASTYSEIVLNIGTRQSEANIQREAAATLLEQSVATRESISGVNLDEEASNLIRLEQAYNASAQVISVAREIFDILFSAVR